MTGPVLRARALDIAYGDRILVRGLDLDICAGQCWALVGPNGAGKSSLLRALAGARAIEGGTLELGGRALGAWPVAALAAWRAVVGDRWSDPFPMPAREVVEAGRYRFARAARADAGRRHVRDCLAQLDCADFADRDVRHLSRGERQRVAIAAALAQDARLLLLDEPLSHQDPRHQLLVLERLRALARDRGTALLAALHDINAAARFASHALLLPGDGRWCAGAAAEVLTGASLSALFGTRIEEFAQAAHRVFLAAGAPGA